VPTFVMRRSGKTPKLDARRVRRLADHMLAALGIEDAELSILLVDDGRIRELNRSHRNKDRPTDVLAFPLPRERRPAPGAPLLLGDVVISLPTALRQARSRGRALLPEVRFLLAHGLLHLMGFDHGTKPEKKRMDQATRRLVRSAVLTPERPRRARSGAKHHARRASTPTSRTGTARGRLDG
jgi:probable rRNA maturation factor